MPLTLRPAQTFSTLNSSQSDDYDVMENAKRVGRLFKTESGTDPWCWSLSTAVWKAGLSGRAATRVLAIQGLSDAYTAISVLNGTEFQGGLSKLSPDSDSGRKRTVRSVAQHVEFSPFRSNAIGRVDRE
jgi:adenylylsulfate kinase-like enzyme